MNRFFWGCILIAFPATLSPAEESTDPLALQIRNIEQLSGDLEDLPKLSSALDLCRRVLKRDPDNRDVLIQTCRICWHLGVQLDDQARARTVFEVGYKHADRLRKLLPDQPDGYYWHAVNYGEIINRSSIFAKIGGMGEIREAAQKTLKLDPDYDSGGAYLILGRINQLSPGGNDRIAEEYFRKAITLAPGRTTGHLYLGELLYDDRKYEEALEQMQWIVDGPHDPRYPIERKLDTPKAREWIERIENRMKRAKKNPQRTK